MFTYKIDDLSYLSLLEIQDANKLYDLINRNRGHIGEWLKFPSMTLKAEDSQAFIERTRISYAKEEGYWLGKEYEGRGLITKSVKVLINHAFDKYKLNKIEIGAATENRRSRAIPEKLGFKQEGELRDYEYIQGRNLNRIIYGLKASEWRSK